MFESFVTALVDVLLYVVCSSILAGISLYGFQLYTRQDSKRACEMNTDTPGDTERKVEQTYSARMKRAFTLGAAIIFIVMAVYFAVKLLAQ
jgi:hypothetical protein